VTAPVDVRKARAELIRRLPYLDYNYGRAHALTVAAECGDLAGFLAAGRHATELTDIVVSGLCDIAARAQGGAK
jgi:hypothetical protein